MSPRLQKLLEQITNRENAVAFSSAIEIDVYGPDRLDGEKWIEEVRAEISKKTHLKWTTEKPTAPGWYWIDEGIIKHIAEVVIAQSSPWSDVPAGEMAIDSDEGILRSLSVAKKFAGPIPEPEE